MHVCSAMRVTGSLLYLSGRGAPYRAISAANLALGLPRAYSVLSQVEGVARFGEEGRNWGWWYVVRGGVGVGVSGGLAGPGLELMLVLMLRPR